MSLQVNVPEDKLVVSSTIRLRKEKGASSNKEVHHTRDANPAMTDDTSRKSSDTDGKQTGTSPSGSERDKFEAGTYDEVEDDTGSNTLTSQAFIRRAFILMCVSQAHIAVFLYTLSPKHSSLARMSHVSHVA